MDGILLVDKPLDWTSFDVVAKIRGILARNQLSVTSAQSEQITDNRSQKTNSRKLKVGHTGTLDPLATGLLVLTLGSYCKRAQEFSKLDKTYEVTMILGQTSTTGDEEGEKASVSSRKPTPSEIEAVLKQFVGEIKQIPPAYSAIKVNGQRAYKLARQGKEVNLESRSVKIYSLELTDYTYPTVKLRTNVSSGAYIRTLVEDVGQKLGTGAYTGSLNRTTVGKFSVQEALSVDALNVDAIKKYAFVLA